MGSIIIPFNTSVADYDSAVEEIDILVPKYLDALQALKEDTNCVNIRTRLNNVAIYWERIAVLFDQLEKVEKSIDFEIAIKNSLQSELTILEEVYFEITDSVDMKDLVDGQELVEMIILRMDRILEELGFDEEHNDRVLMRRLMEDNRVRRSNAKKATG